MNLWMCYASQSLPKMEQTIEVYLSILVIGKICTYQSVDARLQIYDNWEDW